MNRRRPHSGADLVSRQSAAWQAISNIEETIARGQASRRALNPRTAKALQGYSAVIRSTEADIQRILGEAAKAARRSTGGDGKPLGFRRLKKS